MYESPTIRSEVQAASQCTPLTDVNVMSTSDIIHCYHYGLSATLESTGMNIHRKASVFVVCLLVSGCTTHPAREQGKNPLLHPSLLPFQAPPFNKIKDADFAPAFDAGMKEQLAEVEHIADDPAPPSFDNTIAALEKTGQALNRVSPRSGTPSI
jgi:hypothetical protein